MKFTLRKQVGCILVYGFITRIQQQEGITSIIPNSDHHYVLMDMDKISYDEVYKNVKVIADKFKLINVVIMSDKEESYRIFSPTPVPFKTLLHILIETEGVDYMFFKWTVKRGYATIRLSKKLGRKPIKIMNILYHDGEYKPDFESFKFVEYETDTG